MIELSVNGTPYTDFVSADVTLSLPSTANSFSFVASAVNGFPPFRRDDEVTVGVEGVKVLTGTVEEVRGRDGEDDHLVTYSGRDRTGDLIDSQIDTIDDIRTGSSFTLKRLVEIVLAHLGLDLEVVDDVSPAAFNGAEDVISPKVGQSALEFIKFYARKRQVLVSSTADGDVWLTQSAATDPGATVQRLAGADDNNILTQEWDILGPKQFNRYIRRGQLDPRGLNLVAAYFASTLAGQHGTAVDGTVRAGRQQVVVEPKPYSSEQLALRAAWSAQLAAAQATSFRCAVKGHQMPGDRGLWLPNRLVQVASDVADIDRKMLTDSVTFSQGEGRATTTGLTFVEKDVYTLDESIRAQRSTGSLNGIFKSLG